MAQYHIARNGTQLGVFDESDIRPGLATGRFASGDLIWTEGMTDWEPLGNRFQSSLAAPSAATVGGFNPYAAPVANVVSNATVGNYQLASLGQRLGASLLDTLFSGLLIGIPYGVLMYQADQAESGEANETVMIAAGVAMLLGILAWLIIIGVMLTTRGQTPGKRLVGIRVVTHPDGQKAGFVKAFLLRAVVNGVIGAIPCLGSIYVIVDICFIFRENRRCVHDEIAGTMVIQGNPPQ